MVEELEINSLEKLESSRILNIKQSYFSKPLEYNNNKVIMYRRNVDDLFFIIKEDQIHNVQNVFNSFINNLQFMAKNECHNKEISFLDIEINRIENDFAKVN